MELATITMRHYGTSVSVAGAMLRQALHCNPRMSTLRLTTILTAAQGRLEAPSSRNH
jgi:hypothetical protein